MTVQGQLYLLHENLMQWTTRGEVRQRRLSLTSSPVLFLLPSLRARTPNLEIFTFSKHLTLWTQKHSTVHRKHFNVVKTKINAAKIHFYVKREKWKTKAEVAIREAIKKRCFPAEALTKDSTKNKDDILKGGRGEKRDVNKKKRRGRVRKSCSVETVLTSLTPTTTSYIVSASFEAHEPLRGSWKVVF